MTAPLTDTEPGQMRKRRAWIGPTGHGQRGRMSRRALHNGHATGPQRRT
jgi:hypothetical protein